MKQLIKQLGMLIALISTIFFLHSCNEDTSWFPVSGSGKIISQNRTVPEFTKLKSSINANIVISENPDQELGVSIQENLQTYLQTEVVNQTLFISFGTRAVTSDSLITIRIAMPKITEITLSGSGNINSELPLSAINLAGSGNVKCAGKAELVTVNLTGSGVVNLENQICTKADVKLSGNGNISLFVTDELKVRIPGMGVVYYRGLPIVRKDITGIGQLVDLN